MTGRSSTVTRLVAGWADDELAPWVAGGFCGRVAGLYPKAVSIAAGVPGGLISLLAAGGQRAAFTIIVDIPSFADIPLAADAAVTAVDGGLMVGDLFVAVPPQSWQPFPPLVRQAQAGAAAGTLRDLQQALPPPPAGEAHRHLLARSRDMLAAMASHDIARAYTMGKRLLGLGPGLTPAGDDWLCGLCAACRVMAAPAIWEALFHQLAQDAPAGTTLQGAASLYWAGRGKACAPLADFLAAAMAGQGTQQALQRLLAIGSTSGWDMAKGALDGWDLCTNNDLQ